MIFTPSVDILKKYCEYSLDCNDCHNVHVNGSNSLIHGGMISSFLFGTSSVYASPLRVRSKYVSPLQASDQPCRVSELTSPNSKKLLLTNSEGRLVSSLSLEDYSSINIKDFKEPESISTITSHKEVPAVMCGTRYVFNYSTSGGLADLSGNHSPVVWNSFACCSYIVGMLYPGKFSKSLSYDLAIDGKMRTSSFQVVDKNHRLKIARMQVTFDGGFGYIIASYGH